MRIPWNEIPDHVEEDYSPLEEGKYFVFLKNVQERDSSNKNPMWTFEAVVDAGPRRGRKVFDKLMVPYPGCDYESLPHQSFKYNLKRLGFDMDSNPSLDVNYFDLEGKFAIVKVKKEKPEFSEKYEKNIIRNKLPLFAFESATAEDKERINRKEAEKPQAAKQQADHASETTSQNSETIEDDGIPF